MFEVIPEAMPKQIKVGLVLSGGGAKGAYQVGMLKALGELGVKVDAIAGASIGAINGAILAGSPSVTEGAQRMEHLWKTLAEDPPLKFKRAKYLVLLAAAGLALKGSAYTFAMLESLQSLQRKYGIKLPGFSVISELTDTGILSDEPLKKLMDQYLDPAALNKGTPFYVSVFESHGGMIDALKVIVSELGLRDTDPSQFFHIQNQPVEKQKELLLASAALPMIFTPREADRTLYSDGGQGGWQTMQGNTPAQPLVDAGCNLLIVSHLSNGSMWNRKNFSGTTVLEIRPKSSLSRDSGFMGGVKDLLGFDEQRINSWIEQGYQDTLESLEPVIKACTSRLELKASEKVLLASERNNAKADSILNDAMSQL